MTFGVHTLRVRHIVAALRRNIAALRLNLLGGRRAAAAVVRREFLWRLSSAGSYRDARAARNGRAGRGEKQSGCKHKTRFRHLSPPCSQRTRGRPRPECKGYARIDSNPASSISRMRTFLLLLAALVRTGAIAVAPAVLRVRRPSVRHQPRRRETAALEIKTATVVPMRMHAVRSGRGPTGQRARRKQLLHAPRVTRMRKP